MHASWLFPAWKSQSWNRISTSGTGAAASPIQRHGPATRPRSGREAPQKDPCKPRLPNQLRYIAGLGSIFSPSRSQLARLIPTTTTTTITNNNTTNIIAMRTLTFEFAKREVPILLDLCLPDAPSSEPLPIFIWWHGGGLIQGARQAMAAHLKRAVDKYNIAVVSTDYRLCPQVRVPDVQQDMVDCFAYVIEKLPSELAAKGESAEIDTNRIVLSGSSAGGWQCLMVGLGMCAGTKAEHLRKVKGIAAIYPITTMDHPFFLEKQVPFMGYLKDDPSTFAEFRDPNAPVTANTAAIEHRKKFYMHAQQEALFPSLLFSQQQRDDGWLQKTDVQVSLRGSSEDQRKAFPPVYIVHGEKDSAVDVDQARRLEKALKEVGTPVIYDEVPGRDHLWDQLEPEEDLEALWNFTAEKLRA